jgi:hypothetical protein
MSTSSGSIRPGMATTTSDQPEKKLGRCVCEEAGRGGRAEDDPPGSHSGHGPRRREQRESGERPRHVDLAERQNVPGVGRAHRGAPDRCGEEPPSTGDGREGAARLGGVEQGPRGEEREPREHVALRPRCAGERRERELAREDESPEGRPEGRPRHPPCEDVCGDGPRGRQADHEARGRDDGGVQHEPRAREPRHVHVYEPREATHDAGAREE